MIKSLPRAVIFDWDNTLVDSWGAIAESINYARARYGLPIWDMTEIMANCTRSARESFPEWFGDKWELAWDDYYSYFDKTRERLGLTPANGAEPLLKWLQENKIPAVVVSNKSGDYLRQEAIKLNWNRYFLAIVGAHDAARDKPAKEHADMALKLGNIEAGPDVLFVGDSESDVACARNANCTPLLIGSRDYAEKLKVNMYVSDCQELLRLLSDAHRSVA